MNLIELFYFFKVSCVCVRQVDALNILRLQPFTNNQDIHPSEKSKEQKEGGDELEVEVEHIAEVEAVKTFHYNTN